jgi:hypothetical protein
MKTIDTGLTEGDLFDWLEQNLITGELYDPQVHVTYDALAKRYNRNRTWAERELKRLVEEGKLIKVIIYDPDSKNNVAYRRLSPA